MSKLIWGRVVVCPYTVSRDTGHFTDRSSRGMWESESRQSSRVTVQEVDLKHESNTGGSRLNVFCRKRNVQLCY